MKRFTNILLVSGTEDRPIETQALEQTVRLAKRNRAKLTILEVVHKMDLVPEILPLEMFELLVADRRQSLKALAELAQQKGVEVETELAIGKPSIEIVRRVQVFKHDLVVTDGGQSKEKSTGISATTVHLMRKCPCAIWVARPRPTGRYARVLAAIDPYPSDPERDSLNKTIMELAVSIAKLEKSELHVIYAWRLPSTLVDRSNETWLLWEHSARQEVKTRLHDALSKYAPGSMPKVHFVSGKPATVISQLVHEQHIDLLVMGTVCRTGIRGFLIGNTAEGLLRRVNCSLLTVKPEGFVSPIVV